MVLCYALQTRSVKLSVDIEGVVPLGAYTQLVLKGLHGWISVALRTVSYLTLEEQPQIGGMN